MEAHRKSRLTDFVSAEILLTLFLITWPATGSVAAGPSVGGSGGKTATTASRTITTRFGRLQGFVLSFPNPLQPVEVFLGIPYATPPVGINRFSPTRNPAPWPEVRMADRHPPSCPQRLPDIANETQSLKYMSKHRRDYLLRIEPRLRNQSEDCLYLNIYAPAQGRPVDLLDRLPVMVFIHGESYEWGSSHLYDGSVLASYANVVVVTINFRLGVLGFLNVGGWTKNKGGRLGNFGLMDQIAALGWIRDNIAAFGGDPERVTLVGHGTGAACIHFLMNSPAALPGLFHRGILMSGSGLAPWALVNDANDVAMQIAQAANCAHPGIDRGDTESILNCLRDVPLSKIYEAASSIKAKRFRPSFGPSVDGVVVLGDGRTGSNVARGRAGRSEDRAAYDILFGITGFESVYQFSASASEDGFDATERDSLLRTFVSETYRFHQTEIFLTLVNEYTDWERTLQHPLSIRDATIEALSDGQFVAPAIALGDSVSPSEKNAYFYVMDPISIQRPLAFRGLELALLFGSPLLSGLNPASASSPNFSKQEVLLSEVIISLFTNFARSGNPNEPQDVSFRISKERNRFKGLTWETYDKTQKKYLEIGIKPKIRGQFRAHRVAVWLQLFPELQRTGQHDVLAGHGLLGAPDAPPSLPGWVNGSYIDVAKQREESKDVTCSLPQPQTPTASPSTSNTTTNGSISSPTSNSDADGPPLSNDTAVYSTALSVTIAIGCSLLILNVLTFAGLYYRRDRRRQAQAEHLHSSIGECLQAGGSKGGNGRPRTPGAASDSETICLQTPSCNGTLKKGGIYSRQQCCDYLSSVELVTQERSMLDVRYDTSIPSSIPPDKSFL